MNLSINRTRTLLAIFATTWAAATTQAAAPADPELRASALAALKKAATYFSTHVATEGGYLYQYSADLTRREGERGASATTIWVQPPGTPSVGLAFLHAWEATADPFYLEAAHKAGQALVRGQLVSGGWDYEIPFDPADRAKMAFRVDPKHPKGKNVTTLDDDTTQAALRLLMRLDQALVAHGQPDPAVHEAVNYGLQSLLHAQYPNGAWPQRYTEPPDPAKYPVLPASYPKTWDRKWPGQKYNAHYTFNDNALNDVIDVLLEAARLYHDSNYLAAAERGGDFIILSQMPDPQPAWAQQYDAAMTPVWARKFEPPSVTGGESQSVLIMLLDLYRETGKRKYLEPIPKALAYLQSSRLPDGQLARFYELKTNKPLYFTRDYQLTESDADMPTHYSFKISANPLDRIRRDYDALQKTTPGKPVPAVTRKISAPNPTMIARTKAALKSLDDQGRWLDSGRIKSAPGPNGDEPILRTSTFIKNVEALSGYIAASRTPSERSSKSQ